MFSDTFNLSLSSKKLIHENESSIIIENCKSNKILKKVKRNKSSKKVTFDDEIKVFRFSEYKSNSSQAFNFDVYEGSNKSKILWENLIDSYYHNNQIIFFRNMITENFGVGKIHDIHSNNCEIIYNGYKYILPLQPELFDFSKKRIRNFAK